jgi:hypothetical protein
MPTRISGGGGAGSRSRHRNYLRVAKALVDDPRIPPKQRASVRSVYLTMRWFANLTPHDGNICSAAVDTIGDHAGVCKHTVLAAQKVLLDLGYITLERDSLGRTTKHYYVPPEMEDET